MAHREQAMHCSLTACDQQHICPQPPMPFNQDVSTRCMLYMQKCETFTITSTFTARGVTFITHKAKKGRTFSDPARRAHAPVWPNMHIFQQTKRHTQTLESKGLTFANGINPNKETSCFLEHNTAKLLFGAQAVNTQKSQNQFIVHRRTCVSVQRVSVSGNAAGCAFKCRRTRLSLSVAAAGGVCARACACV